MSEPVDLKAVYERSVTMADNMLDEAAKGFETLFLRMTAQPGITPVAFEAAARMIELRRGIGEAYARLAQACQHGAPGERF